MEKAQGDLELSSSNPERLAYVLRNATGEFQWIKDKYTFRVLPGKVKCALKEINVDIEEAENEVIRTVSAPSTLIEIANYIIQDKPDAIRFTEPLLTEGDRIKLETLLEVKNYKLILDDDILTIKKQ